MKVGYCWDCGELKLYHEYLACRLNEHRATPVLMSESGELRASEFNLPQMPLIPRTKRITKSNIYWFLKKKLGVDVEWRTPKEAMTAILIKEMGED